METKIKFKKTIFNLVETIGNDMELGKEVRKLTNEYKQGKKDKKEKTHKTKLSKVDKSKVENQSKKTKLKPMPEPNIGKH